MKFLNTIPLLLLAAILFSTSCRKDEMLTDSSAKLEFSTDSVLFDTVFTTVGSTTRVFKIYNTHNQPLTISNIQLVGGATSQFRINIDGLSAFNFSDVEILGGDSLYAFVQVTVDPFTNASNELLVTDKIIFETNGNSQEVHLTAVGEDVYLHKPDKQVYINGFGIINYSIINCNDIWTDDKPHLIFGYAVVDENCSLTMMAGTRVHLYNKAVLWVFEGGKLDIKGTHGNEVRIEGARLEPDYKDVPGQWGKIWLSRKCKTCSIDWAIIKNGGIGVQADTVLTSGNPTLKISNTIIKNMQAAAIFGQTANIRANNCVFANCGQYVAALTLGGRYSFEHCTFANFWSSSDRTTPLLALNNHYVSQGTDYVFSLDSAYFKNCILDGSLSEEFGIDSSELAGPGYFKYKFDHCIIKTERSVSNAAYYVSPYKNAASDFKNTGSNDYQLNSTSAAKNNGNTIISIFKDLNDANRPDGTSSIPDIGAYEYYP